MDEKRFLYVDDRLKKQVLDFEQNPSAYRDVDDLLEIIDFYGKNGDEENLVKSISVAENMFPDEVEVLVRKAGLFMGQGNRNEAIRLLKQLEKTDGDNINVLYALSDAYSDTPEKCIRYLERAIQSDPENVTLYDAVVQRYLDYNMLDKALKYSKKRFAISSDDADFLLTLLYSSVFSQKEHYSEAVDFFTSFIDHSPYSAKAWEYLARTYTALQQYDKALDASEYMMMLDDTHSSPYLAQLEIKKHIGKFSDPDILSFLHGALDKVLPEERLFIENELANFYFDKDAFVTAAAYYRRTIDNLREYMPPDWGDDFFYDVNVNLGVCYFQLRDDISAEKCFLDALRIFPYDENPFIYLADIWKSDTAHPEKYEQMFERLTVDYSFVEHPWYYYTKYLVDNRRYEDAVQTVEKALKCLHEGVTADLYVLQAVAYFNLNRKNEARLMLRNTEDYDKATVELLKEYPELTEDVEILEILVDKLRKINDDNQGQKSSDDRESIF